MCPSCENIISDMSRCRSAGKLEWTCSICGPQRFEKGDDPKSDPKSPGQVCCETIVTIVFIVAFAAVCIASRFAQ